MRKKNKPTIQDMDDMQNGLHQAYAAAAAKAKDPHIKELFETIRDNDMIAIERAKSEKEASDIVSKKFYALQEVEALAKRNPEAAQLYAEVVQATQKSTEKLRNYLGF